ncbi:MAG: penicillin-binding transpeptidase domain-containing protein [bacterium]
MARARKSPTGKKNQLLRFLFILCGALAAALLIVSVLFVRRGRAAAGRAELERLMSSPWMQEMELSREKNRFSGVFGNYTFSFTMDARMQDMAESLFRRYDPVMGVFVALDPRTGAVLAMAGRARKSDFDFDSVTRPSFLLPFIRSSDYPMASLMKIVTAAAALEEGGFQPGSRVKCTGREDFPGGVIRDPRWVRHGDITFSDALGFSCNPVFGRVGAGLGKRRLEKYMKKFLIGGNVGFDLPLLESAYRLADDELEVARAASGFGEVYISPLHAALVAAAIANDGTMMKPFCIERVSRRDPANTALHEARRSVLASPVGKKTARRIAQMMRLTVEKPGGTARGGFYDKRGKYIAGDFRVAGKTGSLNGRTGAENYTWMIGFVESGQPAFAFACLVRNDEKWTIKAASFMGQFFRNYAAERRP